jgi:hypothetical protein
MSQSQELQNSKIDQTTTKQGNLKGRNLTGSGLAVNPTDLVPLSQVKDLIKQYGGKLFPTSATAQTQQGISNNDNSTAVGSIPSVGVPDAVLFYNAVGQASTDEANFSYQGNGILNLVGLLLSGLTASKPVKTDAFDNLVSGLIVLTTDVSGILPIANGGTGSGTGGYKGPSVQSANLGSNTATSPAGTGARVLGTVYKNNLTVPIFVSVSAAPNNTTGFQLVLFTDGNNPPVYPKMVNYIGTTTISHQGWISVSGWVLPGNFYIVSGFQCETGANGNGTFWTEDQ